MPRIHPTALIEKGARLGEDVEIGPYCVIGAKAVIGDATKLGPHAVIQGNTRIGKRCRVFSHACLGGPAQVHPFKEVDSSVEIGDDNVLREYVTVHASMTPGGRTVVGDRNLFMANSHVGHDATVGSDIVMANSAALGGHVVVEDRSVIGGLVGVHQYVRVGKLAMIGALSKLTMDAAPFSIHDGRPTSFRGLNIIGLRRAGYKSESVAPIKKALKMLLATRSNLAGILPEVEKEFKGNQDVKYVLDFIRASKRGIARSSKEIALDE